MDALLLIDRKSNLSYTDDYEFFDSLSKKLKIEFKLIKTEIREHKSLNSSKTYEIIIYLLESFSKINRKELISFLNDQQNLSVVLSPDNNQVSVTRKNTITTSGKSLDYFADQKSGPLSAEKKDFLQNSDKLKKELENILSYLKARNVFLAEEMIISNYIPNLGAGEVKFFCFPEKIGLLKKHLEDLGYADRIETLRKVYNSERKPLLLKLGICIPEIVPVVGKVNFFSYENDSKPNFTKEEITSILEEKGSRMTADNNITKDDPNEFLSFEGMSDNNLIRELVKRGYKISKKRVI